jgi:hypothetical protein
VYELRVGRREGGAGMKWTIKNTIGNVLFEVEADTFIKAVESKRSYLSNSNLYGAYLPNAYLYGA